MSSAADALATSARHLEDCIEVGHGPSPQRLQQWHYPRRAVVAIEEDCAQIGDVKPAVDDLRTVAVRRLLALLFSKAKSLHRDAARELLERSEAVHHEVGPIPVLPLRGGAADIRRCHRWMWQCIARRRIVTRCWLRLRITQRLLESHDLSLLELHDSSLTLSVLAEPRVLVSQREQHQEHREGCHNTGDL